MTEQTDLTWMPESGGGAWPLEAVRHLDDDWQVRAVISWDDEHRIVFRSLALEPRHDGVPLGGVTSKVWRSAFTGELLDDARGLFLDISEFALQIEAPSWGAPGATGHADEAYAYVAFLYRLAALAGSRSPVESLAESMGCSRATASTRLTAARKRGLLTGSSRGRAGGRLTAKAKRLLEIENAVVF